MSQAPSSRSTPPALTDRLQAMSKVEIHVHLEGAMDAETVSVVASMG